MNSTRGPYSVFIYIYIWDRIPVRARFYSRVQTGSVAWGIETLHEQKLTGHDSLTEQGKGVCDADITLRVSVLFVTHFREIIYKALVSKNITLV